MLNRLVITQEHSAFSNKPRGATTRRCCCCEQNGGRTRCCSSSDGQNGAPDVCIRGCDSQSALEIARPSIRKIEEAAHASGRIGAERNASVEGRHVGRIGSAIGVRSIEVAARVEVAAFNGEQIAAGWVRVIGAAS